MNKQDKQTHPNGKKLYTLERISFTCNNSVEWFLLIIGLTMIIVVNLQVYYRYILNNSLFWSEELARFLLVWMTFLGATVAYHRGLHPGIEVLYRRLPPKFKLWTLNFVHLSSLIFFLVMVWYGWRFTYFVRLQTSPALDLPKWVIFSVIPISGMILSLHAVVFIFMNCKGSTKKQ